MNESSLSVKWELILDCLMIGYFIMSALLVHNEYRDIFDISIPVIVIAFVVISRKRIRGINDELVELNLAKANKASTSFLYISIAIVGLACTSERIVALSTVTFYSIGMITLGILFMFTILRLGLFLYYEKGDI